MQMYSMARTNRLSNKDVKSLLFRFQYLHLLQVPFHGQGCEIKGEDIFHSGYYDRRTGLRRPHMDRDGIECLRPAEVSCIK